MTTLAVEDRTVGIGEFHKVMIKDLAMVFSFPDFSTTHSLCFYRISSFEPVDDIKVVDMLFSDMIAAKPVEIIPVAHLVFHFSLSSGSWFNPNTIIVPPGLGRSDVANHVLALEQFAVGILVVALKTNNYVEFFCFCFFCSNQNTLDTLWVSRDWLFHEDVFSLFHRFFKVNGPETRRCGKDHHISKGNGIFICIKSNKFSFFWNINQFFDVS